MNRPNYDSLPPEDVPTPEKLEAIVGGTPDELQRLSDAMDRIADLGEQAEALDRDYKNSGKPRTPEEYDRYDLDTQEIALRQQAAERDPKRKGRWKRAISRYFRRPLS